MANESSLLGAFADFLLATRQVSISEIDNIVNQATKYRTYLFPLMMKGLSRKEMVQSGTEIVDFIQLAISRSYRHFNPTDDFNYTAENSLTQMKVPWRFTAIDSVTHEVELDLQQGGKDAVFKRVKKAKMQRMEQDFWEGMEDDLWADPNYDAMEASTVSGVGVPLSLRAFVTRAGTQPVGTTGTTTKLIDGIAAGSSAWTTIEQINPTNYTQWRNQVETFDNTSSTTREATVIPALDAMWLDVQYTSPSTSEEYFKNTAMEKMTIVCNKSSQLLLVKLATARNNVLTPKNDIGWAAGNIVYHGIPVRYIGKLDTVDSTVADGDCNGYCWRFLNFNHFKPIFHSNHYRRAQKFDGTSRQPFTNVIVEDTWSNLWCANRREQGIVRVA